MRRIALMVVGIALMLPAAASAQKRQTCATQPCAAAAAPTEDFPFRLLDLALLAGGASVLLAAGMTLRRMSARGSSEPAQESALAVHVPARPLPLPASQPLSSPLTANASNRITVGGRS